MAEHKRGPHAAAERVERLVPGAYCAGKWDEESGRTVYRVWGYDGILGIGTSAMQAWCAADAELQRRNDPDFDDRYLDGEDVQQQIGAVIGGRAAAGG